MVTAQKIVSEKLLALLGSKGIELSDRRLRQIAAEGFFPEPTRSQYDLLATLLGLCRFYRELHLRRADEIQAQELRRLKETADKLALENEKTRGGLVEIEAVISHFQGLFIALRARILASALTDPEKDEILNDLRAIKVPMDRGRQPRDVPEPVRLGNHPEPLGGRAQTAAAA